MEIDNYLSFIFAVNLPLNNKDKMGEGYGFLSKLKPPKLHKVVINQIDYFLVSGA